MIASLSTDFHEPAPDPHERLRQIAQAGFTSIHWCWHWNDDYLYGEAEIRRIAGWLKGLGLVLADLHGSAGKQHRWVAADEASRIAGVELVRNRIEMTGLLGGRAVVMHLEPDRDEPPASHYCLDRLRRSIDELRPALRRHNVRIALENLVRDGHDAILDRAFSEYPPEEVGLCYDSGHGTITGTGLDLLERHATRLLAVHLHDNDAKHDQHRLPFTGQVDWPRLTQLLARSPYLGPMTLEVGAAENEPDDHGFLCLARTAAIRLIAQVQSIRASLGSATESQ